jgi:hypothetical protein
MVGSVWSIVSLASVKVRARLITCSEAEFVLMLSL